jgi:hypothetical protein
MVNEQAARNRERGKHPSWTRLETTRAPFAFLKLRSAVCLEQRQALEEDISSQVGVLIVGKFVSPASLSAF